MAESRGLLSWRKKQKEGTIMKSSTFQSIESGAKAKGLSAERAKKVAGAAYWQAAESKYGKSKGGRLSKKLRKKD